MSRVTVVIEGHAEAIRLGMTLAGGRVVAASEGDLIEQSECDLDEQRRDANRYRAFRAAELPNGIGVYLEELDAACDELAAGIELRSKVKP